MLPYWSIIKDFNPHFLIDDAKLQWRHASYLRSEKNVQKIIFFSLDLSQLLPMTIPFGLFFALLDPVALLGLFAL